MTDLSFFLLKNSLGAKMKKGLRSFCNGVGSTSTLNQRKTTDHDPNMSSMYTPSRLSSSYLDPTIVSESPPTLEEMILQLELEEKAARKSKMDDYRRRMSCVNNSDILRSARNALNQYPRFSLDGRDAMYRSSFRNLTPVGYKGGRKSVCCKGRYCGFDLDSDTSLGRLPPTLAGESVMWCKPGVVAKLMGLEAMPVPISKGRLMRKKNPRREESHEMEKRRVVMSSINDCRGVGRGTRGSCSSAGYCVMKPIAVDPAKGRHVL